MRGISWLAANQLGSQEGLHHGVSKEYGVLNFMQDTELLCDKFCDAKAWDKRNLLQERINHLCPEQNTTLSESSSSSGDWQC